MLRLRPTLKDYAWGKPVNESKAATFGDAGDMKQVAEAWWGSHPSGPAYVGDAPLTDIPYLLKVISVNKALSIQVHPDVGSAKVLHSERPDIYPDAFPKPEMAVALSEFTAMVGFLPDQVIARHLSQHPEFAALAGGAAVAPFTAIENLLRASDDVVAPQTQSLHCRLRAKDAPTDLEEVVLSLLEQYPRDVGVFAPFFMNTVTLSPGYALVIPPKELHAYISGEAVECMAPSDNVVRAGLTPKHKDVGTLLALIEPGFRPPVILEPGDVYAHPAMKAYFTLHRYRCGGQQIQINKPGVALVLNGQGRLGDEDTKEGDSWLIQSPIIASASGDLDIILATQSCKDKRCTPVGS